MVRQNAREVGGESGDRRWEEEQKRGVGGTGLKIRGKSFMDFQENLRLAQEVIDFAMSGQILKIRPVTISPDEFVIERSYVQARRRTLGGYVLEDNFMDWQAVRSREESKTVGAKQGHPHYDLIKTKMREDIDGIEEFLLNTLPAEYTDYYFDSTNDIHADLAACIESRLVMGTANSFFETVFRVYKAGGLPCGWEGKYPDGKLVVFVPESNNSTDV